MRPTARSECRARWRRACRCRSGPGRASARPGRQLKPQSGNVIVSPSTFIWVATTGALLKLAASAYAAIISMPCPACRLRTSTLAQLAARAGALDRTSCGQDGGDADAGDERVAVFHGSLVEVTMRHSRQQARRSPRRRDETAGGGATCRRGGVKCAVTTPQRRPARCAAPAAYSATLARVAFTWARMLLPSSRRRREARVGRVALRTSGTSAASATSVLSRSTASRRFMSWLR